MEWIIVDTSLEDHSDLIPVNEHILYIKINSSDYLEKINFKFDDEKVIWNYFEKTKEGISVRYISISCIEADGSVQ